MFSLYYAKEVQSQFSAHIFLQNPEPVVNLGNYFVNNKLAIKNVRTDLGLMSCSFWPIVIRVF